ncbi:hypothetical protein PG997_008921 [Apiospora hydei]|uniref:Uncharacterized protein n=1 Tax=Apiospora hydei TaxID=1337664 RepID=A0ABR1WC59_9PEZI
MLGIRHERLEHSSPDHLSKPLELGIQAVFDFADVTQDLIDASSLLRVHILNQSVIRETHLVTNTLDQALDHLDSLFDMLVVEPIVKGRPEPVPRGAVPLHAVAEEGEDVLVE